MKQLLDFLNKISNFLNLLLEDAVKFAKIDFANHNKEDGWKPGEKKLMKKAGVFRKELLVKIKEVGTEIDLQKKMLQEVVTRRSQMQDTTELSKVNKDIEEIESQIRDKEKKLEELKKQVSRMETSYDRIELLVHENKIVEEKKTDKEKITFFEVGSITMLAVLAIIDSQIFYHALKAVANIMWLNLSASIFVVISVFSFSYLVKQHNSKKFWFGYLFFLIIAVFPQFTSPQNPNIALSNLLRDTRHILFFILSFGGSIAITYTLSKRAKKENLQESLNTEVKDSDGSIPTEEINKYKQLKKKISSSEEEIRDMKTNLEKLFHKRTQILADQDDERKKNEESTSQAAIEIDHSIRELEGIKEKLENELTDLDSKTIEAIQAYRNEIRVLQLINGDDTDWQFEDLNNNNLNIAV